jgi:hypothetical protein
VQQELSAAPAALETGSLEADLNMGSFGLSVQQELSAAPAALETGSLEETQHGSVCVSHTKNAGSVVSRKNMFFFVFIQGPRNCDANFANDKNAYPVFFCFHPIHGTNFSVAYQ